MRRILSLSLIVMLALLNISGCSVLKPDAETTYPLDNEDTRRAKRGKLTGDGINIFDLGGGNKKGGYGSGIGVNAFLWRATLDTLSFMPLAQVDPHGGVIITDWYEDPNARGERFKVNVLILGAELRTDGVKVSAFRQVAKNSAWIDSGSDTATARELEDTILTRARNLRIKSAN